MSDPIRITVGWPDKALWSNGGHGHWGTRHKATKAAKSEAEWSTRIAKPRDWTHDGNPIPVHIVASPKTANAVDKQNLISGLKAHFDGIAAGLGVDDKHFEAPTVEWAEPVKGGTVTITIGGTA